MGHWGGNFDFHPFLSLTFSIITNVLFVFMILNPEAPLLINSQVIQELEQHIKVGAGPDPDNTLGDYIATNFLHHHLCQFFVFLFGCPFPTHA
ncbi:MAG TPA: hypothetical protein VF313_11900 [Anaerolineaceae bacterium]